MKEEHIKLYNNKSKLNLSLVTMIVIIVAILCTRYLLMMLWGAVSYNQVKFTEKDIQILITIFSVASVFFWAIAIRLIIKIIRITPVLELDESGIIENGGFIPWDLIEKIAPFTMDTGYNSRKYLGIWVKDLEALCRNSSMLKAEEMRDNVLSGAAPISIEECMLEESIEDTIRRIYRFKKKVYDERRGNDI